MRHLFLAFVIVIICGTVIVLKMETIAPKRPFCKRSQDDVTTRSATSRPSVTSSTANATLTSSKPTPQPGTVESRPSHANITIDDVTITVKTTKRYYATRIELILKTWFKTAKGQVSFISDAVTPEYANKIGHGNLINARCGQTHNLSDLCCKTDAEFSRFFATPNNKWWCHFDDDQYVNVDRLIRFLAEHDWNKSWYLGKLSRPIWKTIFLGRRYSFKFGTGGAGYCLSRNLMLQMTPWIGSGKLPVTCLVGDAADDVIIGLIAMGMMGCPLTESLLFNAHNRPMKKIKPSELKKQVSVAYSLQGKVPNVVNMESLNPRFNNTEDPTRIISLHCYIHPEDEICR